MAADPVHQRSAAGTHWTTVNAAEAIPGTTTPLTWAFYSDATELALRETFATMGVLRRRDVVLPADADERFIGIFHAHPAVNLNRFRLMADLAPGGSGDALEEQFFGTVRSGVAPVHARHRYPVVAMRMPRALARVSRRVHDARGEAHTWWRIAAASPAEPARDRALVREGADLYRRVLVWHGAGTMLTQGVFDQLVRLCAAAGQTGAETELVGGLDGVEEGEVLADLWAVSRGALDASAIVARHGFHGPDEGELSAVVWRERPALLDPLIAAFAAMDDDEAPDAVRRRSRDVSRRAQARLREAAGVAARVRVALLLALVRHLMPLREVGRGALVRAVDGTRCAARRCGAALAVDGRLDDPEDVFFLTLDELCATVPPPDARALVAERRARHADHLETLLPENWDGDPEPVAAIALEGSELRGTPASPGVVEATARVITSPTDGDELQAGEVLVCRTTDPGWAALMHISGALVIDVGGPLSHGAIVARELGVPCVIGTKSGTTAIRTGDRVRVDGSAGHVTVLERSGAPPPGVT